MTRTPYLVGIVLGALLLSPSDGMGQVIEPAVPYAARPRAFQVRLVGQAVADQRIEFTGKPVELTF